MKKQFIGFLLFLFITFCMLNISCTKETGLKIGQQYEGGIIFYLDGSKTHGMVCASSDQSVGTTWFNYDTTSPGATGTAVGTGMANTELIVAKYGYGDYAAKICYDLELNGFDDWFLPSKDELKLIHENLYNQDIGNFSDKYYWSSSEYKESSGFHAAWFHYFKDWGTIENYTYDVFLKLRVRAVRSF